MTASLVLYPGSRVCVSSEELRGVLPRPGCVVRVERGAWGFDAMICGVTDDVRGGCRLYYGQVVDVWGDVPCA